MSRRLYRRRPASLAAERHGFVDEADGFIEDGRATIEMRKLF
jgi:hypothetical protein